MVDSLNGKLLTVKDVAAKLQVTIDTVYQLIASGKLRASRISDAPKARYRVTQEDLITFINQQRR